MLDHKICCIKGCEKPSLALGLCAKHWRRNRLYGSPVAAKKHSGMFRGLPPLERFRMQYKFADSGCWVWTGGVDQDGYGTFRAEAIGVMHQRAHRWSWAYHNNQMIPKGGMICHKCDNPCCVNPEHLFLGDALVNMQDKIAKGRQRVAIGAFAGPAKITEEQASDILVDPRPYAAIAADYGISASTVGSIKQRVSWQHVKGEAVKAKRVSPRKGKSNRITPDIVREIRTSTDSGAKLSAQYGISKQTVCDIRKRRSWAHIE